MNVTGPEERHVAVSALKAAVPYLRLYQGTTFVIKAGGEAFEEEVATHALVEQVSVLHRVGIHVVLVHGGGPQTSKLSKELGLETRMVEGRRVTCDRTLESSIMALCGNVNTRVVAACRRVGLPAVGITGIDAGLVVAERRPPRAIAGGELVDYGHVGDIRDIDASLPRKLIADGFVPVVSPLSADGGGAILNVNADVAAAAIAAEMGAAKLILMTAVEGIRTDPEDAGTLVSYTDLAGLEEMRVAGSLEGGMLPKTAAVTTALQGGVPRVHIISWRQPDSLLLEIFTNEGSGTMVVRDTGELAPKEQGT